VLSVKPALLVIEYVTRYVPALDVFTLPDIVTSPEISPSVSSIANAPCSTYGEPPRCRIIGLEPIIVSTGGRAGATVVGSGVVGSGVVGSGVVGSGVVGSGVVGAGVVGAAVVGSGVVGSGVVGAGVVGATVVGSGVVGAAVVGSGTTTGAARACAAARVLPMSIVPKPS